MVFFDVENSSRRDHVASMLAQLGLPDGGNHTKVIAIGNWRVVGAETARLLAHAGADLIHSAPVLGVKDWSDLRIAVDAGRWLGTAQPTDVLEIVSDDQASMPLATSPPRSEYASAVSRTGRWYDKAHCHLVRCARRQDDPGAGGRNVGPHHSIRTEIFETVH